VLDRQRRRLLFFAVFNGIDIALAEMSAITALISYGSSFAIDGNGAIVGPLGQTHQSYRFYRGGRARPFSELPLSNVAVLFMNTARRQTFSLCGHFDLAGVLILKMGRECVL